MSVYTITFGKNFARAAKFPFNGQTDLFLRAWAQAEGCYATHNPFATTQPATGATNFNSVGVKNYVSWGQGVAKTAETLLNGKYEPLVEELRRGQSSTEMALALADTPWGTGELTHKVLIYGGPKDYPFGSCYPEPPVRWSRTIKPSMTGPDVDELLRHINRRLGYGPDSTKGHKWYSAAPVGWVKEWQRLRPWLWPADGIVGPKTFRSICGHD